MNIFLKFHREKRISAHDESVNPRRTSLVLQTYQAKCKSVHILTLSLPYRYKVLYLLNFYWLNNCFIDLPLADSFAEANGSSMLLFCGCNSRTCWSRLSLLNLWPSFFITLHCQITSRNGKKGMQALLSSLQIKRIWTRCVCLILFQLLFLL